MANELPYLEEYRKSSYHQGELTELKKARYAAKRLGRALEVLPRVDEDGHSECPFAEQLYRQKEEAAHEARAATAPVKHALQVVQKEHTRCRRALVAMDSASNRLRQVVTRVRLHEDAQREADHLKRLLEQRSGLESILNTLVALLHESANRKFPGSEDDGSRAKKKWRVQESVPAMEGPR